MRRALLLAAALLAAWLAPAGAATITVLNLDGPGEGFNDPTPVAPVGGNPGTTLGQQRLNLFQHAAAMWASVLTSAVEIRVQAQFNSIAGCTATSGVLGSASTLSLHSNFAGAPMANTQYHQALANKLAGVDLTTADDMSITYNSDVDNPVCLGDRDWYYGYDGNEGNDIELLPVVLHELGHGLGFSAQVSTSGAFPSSNGGLPTLYSRFTLDTSTGLYWSAMTNAERAASFVNTGNVVWDGAAVNAQAPLILEPRRKLTVNSPPVIAGSYVVGTATFGADASNPVVTALVALADDGVAPNPNDACEPLINGPALAGKVALIDRGTCTFVLKAQAAQAAGAVGVIIADNVSSPIPPELGGSEPSVTIPVVGITMADGNLLKANLGSGVNVTLGGQHPTAKAGLHASGKVLLYAPNPVESGSSISHWDRSALPNLLMEPAINQSLHTWIDLTRYHFKDLGWFPGGTTVAVNPTPGFSEPLRSVPNPFASLTAIHFRLDRQGGAALDVFDLGGRRVRHFAAADLPPGPHAIAWDGRDEAGARVPAGVYLVRLTSGGRTETGRTVRIE